MNKKEFNKLKTVVAHWANKIEFESKIYFYGSRYKNSNSPDSDLDLAIELIGINESWRKWFKLHEPWQKELSSLLNHKVHLELYEGDDSPKLKKILSNESCIIFP